MIRGKSQTLKFNIPFDAALVKKCYVTMAQSGRVVAEKTTKACTLQGRSIACTFTQKDTQQLHPARKVEIQLRVKTGTGEEYESEIFEERVERILKEGKI